LTSLRNFIFCFLSADFQEREEGGKQDEDGEENGDDLSLEAKLRNDQNIQVGTPNHTGLCFLFFL